MKKPANKGKRIIKIKRTSRIRQPEEDGSVYWLLTALKAIAVFIIFVSLAIWISMVVNSGTWVYEISDEHGCLANGATNESITVWNPEVGACMYPDMIFNPEKLAAAKLAMSATNYSSTIGGIWTMRSPDSYLIESIGHAENRREFAVVFKGTLVRSPDWVTPNPNQCENWGGRWVELNSLEMNSKPLCNEGEVPIDEWWDNERFGCCMPIEEPYSSN